MPDPRVFFAAERTLLAWVRSGLTIIALGFVVARFGLFLTLVSASAIPSGAVQHTHWPSSSLGITLVVSGAAFIFGALRNHRLYLRSLPPDDVPALALPWLTSFMAVSVATTGMLLAVYLAII